MERQNGFTWFPMVNTEPVFAVFATVAIDAPSGSFPRGLEAMAKRTGGGSSGSPFLRMNMLSMGKMAFPCYISTFLGAQNGTLSL